MGQCWRDKQLSDKALETRLHSLINKKQRHRSGPVHFAGFIILWPVAACCFKLAEKRISKKIIHCELEIKRREQHYAQIRERRQTTNTIDYCHLRRQPRPSYLSHPTQSDQVNNEILPIYIELSNLVEYDNDELIENLNNLPNQEQVEIYLNNVQDNNNQILTNHSLVQQHAPPTYYESCCLDE
eukprot:Pgem_evm3s15834